MAKDRTGSDISGMNKQQLLEVLLEQSKEAEAMKRENIELQKELLRMKKLADGYRSDLDHAYSLLRLTMRLEKVIQKLDPSYVPDHYEPGILDRLQEEDAARTAEDEKDVLNVEIAPEPDEVEEALNAEEEIAVDEPAEENAIW
ncbi:MAG: hypothetical protein E7236_03550 [Lachnospiraceae bacterium]|nr:hypothetical protein [Lachnospiraceae bacterium]